MGLNFLKGGREPPGQLFLELRRGCGVLLMKQMGKGDPPKG